AAIADIRPGQPLAEVLAACGAPLEMWRQPEGLLLIYRRRHYDFTRVGIDPSRGIRLFGISNAAATTALGNLKLTYETAELTADRLAVLLDRADRVVAVAYRSRDEGRAAPAPPGERR